MKLPATTSYADHLTFNPSATARPIHDGMEDGDPEQNEKEPAEHSDHLMKENPWLEFVSVDSQIRSPSRATGPDHGNHLGRAT
jgi:hypothetical protein